MTAALVIATGRTSGKQQFEPEKEIGTITALERIVLLFQQAGIPRIVVVCDRDDNRIEKLVSHMNLIFLHSSSTGEMLDSVKTGLSYLQDKCAQVLISHVDVPLFSVKTVQSLIAAESGLCIPAYHGRPGHPILLSSEYFPQILSYFGEGGLAGAIKSAQLPRQMIHVEDKGILSDIQRETSYEHLVTAHDISEIRPSFRFRLYKERPFYGPGTHQILLLVEETGSLSQACRHMGISYSKGRKIIFTLEQQLGYPVIESQQGGKHGGFSYLTKDAKELMQNYKAFCEEAEDVLQSLFQKHFPSQCRIEK